jgi:hypothetical protein
LIGEGVSAENCSRGSVKVRTTWLVETDMDFDRYSTSAYSYWDRSRRLLNAFEQARHQLFYAAYELRCAIEAFLYDYLYFLHDGQLSKENLKKYLEKDLKKAIRKFEPDFEKRIEFDNILHAVMGLSIIEIPVPDLDRLGYLYGRIGGFMHIQKEAMDSDGSATRWLELENLVKESQSFMHDLVHPQKGRLELTVNGVALFEEFKAGTKTQEEVEAEVRSDETNAKYFSGAKFIM